MSSNLRAGIKAGLVVGLVLLGAIGCSKSNPVPPPPLTTQPTGPGYPGGTFTGACGGAYGLPIFPQDQTGAPFTGTLNLAGGMGAGYSGQSGPGSISLSVYYADNYSDKIVGSAQMQIDLAAILGYPQGTIQPQGICVSSVDPYTGQTSQSGRGAAYGSQFLVSTLVMKGQVQLPSYNYQAYPSPITVQVGSACNSVVDRYTRRLQGCVEVWVQSPQGTRYMPYYAN